jgi:hypothetical protein
VRSIDFFNRLLIREEGLGSAKDEAGTGSFRHRSKAVSLERETKRSQVLWAFGMDQQGPANKRRKHSASSARIAGLGG